MFVMLIKLDTILEVHWTVNTRDKQNTSGMRKDKNYHAKEKSFDSNFAITRCATFSLPAAYDFSHEGQRYLTASS